MNKSHGLLTKGEARSIADKKKGVVGEYTTNGRKYFVVHIGNKTIGRNL